MAVPKDARLAWLDSSVAFRRPTCLCAFKYCLLNQAFTSSNALMRSSVLSIPRSSFALSWASRTWDMRQSSSVSSAASWISWDMRQSSSVSSAASWISWFVNRKKNSSSSPAPSRLSACPPLPPRPKRSSSSSSSSALSFSLASSLSSSSSSPPSPSRSPKSLVSSGAAILSKDSRVWRFMWTSWKFCVFSSLKTSNSSMATLRWPRGDRSSRWATLLRRPTLGGDGARSRPATMASACSERTSSRARIAATTSSVRSASHSSSPVRAWKRRP
mmetsp:Transcript_62372/g.203504  ORF Transcript_62372/g.203504 Transcript_62372/m.203504 type:complete len:273 (+) Transcript_62372:1134-1952(+)